MKTLLSSFSHFWASCKMLLHPPCLQCSVRGVYTVCRGLQCSVKRGAKQCRAAQCSAPQPLDTWPACLAGALVLCQLWNIFAKFFQHFARWEIWPKFSAPDNFQIPLLVLDLSHTQWWPPSATLPKQQNVMQSSLTFHNNKKQTYLNEKSGLTINSLTWT